MSAFQRFDFLQMNDADLLDAYLAGDARAMDVLCRRHWQSVYYQCLQFAKEEELAADLTQEVMLKAIQKLEHFKGSAKFSTWLYAIAYNHCVDWFRRKKHLRFVNIDEAFSDLPDDNDAELQEEQAMRLGQVRKAMEGLTERDQQLLLLKYEQHYSIKQLQELFGLSESAVKMRLKRSRSRIMSCCAA